jgi:acetate kinase
VNVLVLNAGSSTLKYQVIATDLDRIEQDSDERLAHGAVEGAVNHAALERILQSISVNIDAVGHRVVHGGELFSESVLIDDAVIAGIEQCVELAPLHNPASLEGIRAARRYFGAALLQVAVFDTAFHHTLPEHAYLYAIPYRLYEQHRVRRYGFHGTSHRYVAHRYRQLRGLNREQTNIISLHLGNGCSIAAIQGGISIDTSMGMTPLEGLVMGTRSGDLDPAVTGVIAAKENLSIDAVELYLNRECGLAGISGFSSDMRELLAHLDNPRARLAVEMFCYRARKYIGAYLAAMGGAADAIVLTGGIGENSPEIRERMCDGLSWAGLNIDKDKNFQPGSDGRRISTDQSRVAAYCIPTDEELLIARDTVRCILGVPHPS